ncbi:hypothetical protein CFOL_v3_13169, partial [Cephalotus follicularis]
ISGLRSDSGEWCIEKHQIIKIATDYFSNLFNSQNPSNVDRVLNCLNPVISEEMNEDLNQPYTRAEIKSKKVLFSMLKDRLRSKLKGWKEKLLSKEGREVLIKAMAQDIPTYSMSLFRLPAGFCEDLTKMERNFWLGQKNEERRIHWVTWPKVYESKMQDGLGFKDLEAFNLVMLAKQCWKQL